jgi:hypothetical protein
MLTLADLPALAVAVERDMTLHTFRDAAPGVAAPAV